jgi:ribosome assembly protein SQT1
MSAHKPHNQTSDDEQEDESDMLGVDEAEEEIEDDGDVEMDSGDDEMQEDEVILLQNDSVAHFEGHKDSIFCIAQHPTQSDIVATGGGDDLGYIWDTAPPPGPLLPSSYESSPQPRERKGQDAIVKLEGHKDSINGITFTLPKGEYVVTAGLDSQIRVWHDKLGDAKNWAFLAEATEDIEDINWLIPCPSEEHPNTIALGAGNGSVWVYTIDATESASPLTPVQAYYVHTAPCTAGAWTPDGKLLATVSEDSSLYVWDVWGDAAEAGFGSSQGAQHIISLTGEDERFLVEGGLYSVAISPGGALCAVGGAEGAIRVVGLPRFNVPTASVGQKGAGARNKIGGGKQAAAKGATGSQGQAGQILASLQAQSDSVETIAFAAPPLTLMAAGSVDGSIVIFDAAHNFAKRRKIEAAHEEEAVIKLEFVKPGTGGANGWLLTSSGNDGVVKRWDVRGGTAAAAQGLKGEWKGHRGGGEGGGIMGFVQGFGGRRVVTAGDDGVSLVFSTPLDQ